MMETIGLVLLVILIIGIFYFDPAVDDIYISGKRRYIIWYTYKGIRSYFILI